MIFVEISKYLIFGYNLNFKFLFVIFSQKNQRRYLFSNTELNMTFKKVKSLILVGFFHAVTSLTLQAPIPKDGQTRSNNLSATANELFHCV